MPRASKFELPPLNLGSETIGQRIARLRKEKGLSQTELAERIGIEQKLVSDYETGKLRLYDEMLARFAIALDVSADVILGFESRRPVERKPSLRVWRRLKRIESLPPAQQKALLSTIDGFLEGRQGNGGKAEER